MGFLSEPCSSFGFCGFGDDDGDPVVHRTTWPVLLLVSSQRFPTVDRQFVSCGKLHPVYDLQDVLARQQTPEQSKHAVELELTWAAVLSLWQGVVYRQ